MGLCRWFLGYGLTRQVEATKPRHRSGLFVFVSASSLELSSRRLARYAHPSSPDVGTKMPPSFWVSSYSRVTLSATLRPNLGTRYTDKCQSATGITIDLDQ